MWAMTPKNARRRHGVWLTGLAVAFASFAAASPGSAAQAAAGHTRALRRAETVPPGFTDTVVANVNEPVAMTATPDGRILVVDQTGKIRVIRNGKLFATPALDISAKVCATNSERGMLGIAVDPKFATNGFVYVYYTFKKFPICKRDITNVPVNRVSRFKVAGNTISASSEKILIDGMISYHGNHNAGDLGFGKDGMLYASVGDGGCDYTGASGCGPDNAIALTTFNLQGKVLRITPAGGIPAGNPFTGAGTARCNHGPVGTNLKCQEIYLYGLRNPFRFAFDPNAPTTRMFVNDVGEFTWEEIDDAVAGANY
jgi:glucose/arabinose dehydrogenase